MSRLRFKAHVILEPVTPALTFMQTILEEVAAMMDLPVLTITSGYDGRHKPHSKHYLGQALDVRTKNLPTTAVKRKLAQLLRTRLGAEFTVLLERLNTPHEHMHIQVRKGLTYPAP